MAKKILIVEDNIVILTMQKQIFEMEGYEIITARRVWMPSRRSMKRARMSSSWMSIYPG